MKIKYIQIQITHKFIYLSELRQLEKRKHRRNKFNIAKFRAFLIAYTI